MVRLLDVWQFDAWAPVEDIILPDGCRDLIYIETQGEAPKWFVSPFYDCAATVTTPHSTAMIGFRLRPGVDIDEQALLRELGGLDPHNADVEDVLNSFVSIDAFTEDALSGLAEIDANSRSLVRRLGVSQRTLQRRLLLSTGKRPLYWMRLARVRRAARLLNKEKSISGLAHFCGYADQSHLTREFQHWFGMTPKAFMAQPDLATSINSVGYD